LTKKSLCKTPGLTKNSFVSTKYEQLPYLYFNNAFGKPLSIQTKQGFPERQLNLGCINNYKHTSLMWVWQFNHAELRAPASAIGNDKRAPAGQEWISHGL
jgi:hypothetical protein